MPDWADSALALDNTSLIVANWRPSIDGTNGTPRISVSPTPVDFALVKIGTTVSETITLTNTGTANLVLDTLALGGTDVLDFALSQDDCSTQVLLPAMSCSVTTTFVPATPGSKNATLTIPSNDTSTPILVSALSGTAEVENLKRR